MPVYEYQIRAFVDDRGDLRRFPRWDVDALGTSPADAVRKAASGLRCPPRTVHVIGDTSIRVHAGLGRAVVFVIDKHSGRRVA